MAGPWYAIGGTSNDLSVLSNWKPNRDGSGTSPSSFDPGEVFVIEQAPASNPSLPWVGNLNDDVLDMIVNYGGPIGEAGNPLRFAVNGTLRVNRVGGATQYMAPVGTGANQTWNRCRVEQTGRGSVVFNHAAAVQCDDLAVSSGCSVECGANFWFKASTGVFRCDVGSSVLIIGTSTIASMIVCGQATSSRPATRIDVGQGGYLKTVGSGAAIGKVMVHGGGTLVHHAAGTITESEVLPGGRATALGSPYRPSVTAVKVWPGGKNFNDNSAVLEDASEDVVAVPSGGR